MSFGQYAGRDVNGQQAASGGVITDGNSGTISTGNTGTINTGTISGGNIAGQGGNISVGAGGRASKTLRELLEGKVKEEVVKVLEEQEVTTYILPDITDLQLQEMGVKAKGSRIAIRKAAKEL